MEGPQLYTEQELVNRLRERTQSAFSYLYDSYASALNGVIVNIIRDHDMAGDVLQEVFVKIWRQIENYDVSKGRLFTWMFNIARNTAIDTLRSKAWKNTRRNSSITEDTAGIQDQGVRVADETGVRKAVQKLKEEHKVLVELSYFQGYTQEEISGMLDIPLGTVKTRLRAAIVQLKQQIVI